MKETLLYGNKDALRLTLLCFVLFFILPSCQEPEPFPTTPQIEFKSLEFVEIEENGIADSLILKFTFQDGDGDLGLPADDIFFPIQNYFVITGDDAKPISISSPLPSDQHIYVPPYFTTADTFNLPNTGYLFQFDGDFSEMPDYECEHFELIYINEDRTNFYENGSDKRDGYTLDTVLVYRNPNRYNFYIDFYRKRGDSYEILDLAASSANGCSIPFHGRFPLLDLDNIGNSLEGTIKYSMTSLGFRISIRSDEFKIKFYILDHHFNKSNVIETRDFTLDELLRQ